MMMQSKTDNIAAKSKNIKLSLYLVLILLLLFVVLWKNGLFYSIVPVENNSSQSDQLTQRGRLVAELRNSATNLAFTQVDLLSSPTAKGYYVAVARVDDSFFEECDCPSGVQCEPCAPSWASLVFENCHCGPGELCKICEPQPPKTMNKIYLPQELGKSIVKGAYYSFLFRKFESAPVQIIDYVEEK